MKTPAVRKAAFFIAASLLLMPAVAAAGTTGVISGHVYSEYGFPLGGATVELVNLRDSHILNREVDFKRGVIDTRVTDGSGFFVFLSLDPGLYVVRPLLNGWDLYCLPRVIVAADQVSFIDMAMSQPEVRVSCGEQQYFGPF